MKKTTILMTTVLMLSLSACKKQNNTETPAPEPQDCHCNIEEAMPNTKGELITIGKGNKAIHLEKKDGTYIMGGDMILTDQQVDYLKQKHEPTGVRTESTRTGDFNKSWPDGTVYYDLDDNLSATKQGWVSGAIKHWEDHTNLHFVKRKKETDYVRFRSGDGCSSHVGMSGGRQYVTLGNCSLGKTIHEIGHAIGLYHEQTRDDRDQYVIINEDNIKSGNEHNFEIKEGSITEGSFDFGSIMMYDSYEFSKNGSPTITKLDGSTFTKQRNGLSAKDIAGVNILYP